MPRSGPAIKRLEQEFHTLSPQLKLAARYVLDAPDDVALSPVREVAARAGVHPSTLVRLAKRFDFDSYVAFRETFRRRFRARPATLTARAHHLQARDRAGAGDLFGELRQAALDNVDATFSGIDATQLEAVADTLLEARRISVVGMRKCFPVAYAMHYAIRMFRNDVNLVTGFAQTMADEVREIGAGDVLIAISYDPYTQGTVAAVEFARSRGAAVVAITDSAVSPIAAVARHVLLVANAGPTFFRSVAAALALSEALVAYMLARGGERNLDILAQSEQQLVRFGAYWQPSRSGRAPI